MNDVTVFCDLPHDIEEGRCVLCERDSAIGELVAFQEAVLSVHGTLWNSVYAKAQQISQQNPLYGMSVKKRSDAYPQLVEALKAIHKMTQPHSPTNLFGLADSPISMRENIKERAADLLRFLGEDE